MAISTGSGQSNTLVAVFENRDDAVQAVQELEHSGFRHDQVGFAIRGSEAVRGGMITDATGTKDGRGALTGMVTGGVVGGVLAAAASLVFPPLGPVVAAGLLTMAFGGAIAGTAVGGILGAMTGLGVSEEEARFYEREFTSGRAIVAVKAGPRAADAGEILRRHGGYDLHNRPHTPVETEGVFSQT